MQLDGSPPWTPAPTAYSRNGVYGLKHLLTIRHLRTRECNGERHTSPVYHLMAFRARLATICWVRSDGAPFYEVRHKPRTLTRPRLARRQSIWSVCSNRFSSRWCKFCHTPAWCHSHRRRQQVIPLPHPISCGSISHGMPLFKTNKMPVKAARSERRGRPRPLGCGGGGGRERLHHFPQRIINQFLCHAASILAQAFLLVALTVIWTELEPGFTFKRIK